MKILLFAGAGASMELGVPGMLGMGKEFLDHSKQWNVEPELVQKLMGDSFDVEHLIEALDRICTARSSLEAIGQNTVPLEKINKVRAEVEWFVQHAAERVVARDAKLMWGSVLRASTTQDITLVTTNYDRAIELAANAEEIQLDDGFDEFGQGETALWVGFGQNKQRSPLVKLHGSTDWYAVDKTESPTKLRHPMPLFGRAALHLSDGQRLGSALVLPSREKLLTHDPYPRLSQIFLNAADRCEMAIFVGSSLRDHHIRGAVQTTAHRVPVFIINPEGDGYGLDKVHTIKQFASTFLIAILPDALKTANPIETLKAVAARPNEERTGTLMAVRQALDVDEKSVLRCRSLEDMDMMEVTLDPFLLRKLLSDRDATVARYSLGLISQSAERDDLIKEAESCPHASDRAFQQDLYFLRMMIKRSDSGTAETSGSDSID